MANKYSHWYNNDFYGDKVILAQQYRELLELPFYYGKHGALKIETYRKPPANLGRKMIEYVEWMMIGIFATGQNMTMCQLNSYLLLKNIVIRNESLKDKIEHLIHNGVLERNMICAGEGFTQWESGRKTAKVVSYRPTRKGYAMAKSLGLPKYNFKKYCQLTNSLRGKLLLSMRAILWNQIVLNQMLYNPGLLWFRMGEFYRLDQGRFMELPLYVKTKDGEYYFEYLHVMADAVIEHTFSLWIQYVMQKGRPFTFVLVTDEYHVASIVGRHVNRAREAGIKVATTVASDWFGEEAGIIKMLM